MATNSNSAVARLVPALRYRDVAAAVPWLCQAFGFEQQHVVTAPDGTIQQAQLSLGDSMVMLLPVGGSHLDDVMKQPDEIDGAETQSCYFYVPDADGHYAAAKAAGARVVLEIREYGNGCRGYSCRDLEGHIWSFGTYDPWLGKAAAPHRAPARRNGMGLAMAAAAAVIVAAVTAGWHALAPKVPVRELERLRFEVLTTQQRADELAARADRYTADLSHERSAKEAALRAAQLARDQFDRAEQAREAIEITARQTEKALIDARRARDAAERAANANAEAAQRERVARGVAEQNAEQLLIELAEERQAREAAQKAASMANREAVKERAGKAVSRRVAAEISKQLTAEREARWRAEQAAQDALEALDKEQAAREGAERSLRLAREHLDEMRRAERTVEQRPAKEVISPPHKEAIRPPQKDATRPPQRIVKRPPPMVPRSTAKRIEPASQ